MWNARKSGNSRFETSRGDTGLEDDVVQGKGMERVGEQEKRCSTSVLHCPSTTGVYANSSRCG